SGTSKQGLEHVRVIVGPDANVWRIAQRPPARAATEPEHIAGLPRQYDPGRCDPTPPGVFVRNPVLTSHIPLQPRFANQRRERRLEVQKSVRDVNRDCAPWSQPAEVEFKRLLREQMHG